MRLAIATYDLKRDWPSRFYHPRYAWTQQCQIVFAIAIGGARKFRAIEVIKSFASIFLVLKVQTWLACIHLWSEGRRPEMSLRSFEAK